MEIAIVTKDRPTSLESTLERLESLGLTDKILVIDGSKNIETKDICQKYSVRHFQQESSGMTAARNEAIKHCEAEYIVFIDDDVFVSSEWYSTLVEELQKPGIKGATGKLENTSMDFSLTERVARNLLYGSDEKPGFVGKDGTIGGHFNIDRRSEVDHMPGCNMAYEVSALETVGGFDTDFDRGNSYREETYTSYQVSKVGKLIYNPNAGLDHLKIDENRDINTTLYSMSYNTRLFLYKCDILDGVLDNLSHIFRNILLNMAYLSKYKENYYYYLAGEINSFIDIHIKELFK